MAGGFTIDLTPLKAMHEVVKSSEFRREVARAGAQEAVQQVEMAFRTGGAHYGDPWAPRSKRTMQAVGAASTGARTAQAKAAKFQREAIEQDYASVWLTGNKREKAEAKAEKAREKAREWRGKARKASADAAAGKPILVDTGTLRKSFFVEDAGGDAFSVATPVPYAKYHEYGTKKMPSRPVMPIDPQGNPRGGKVEAAIKRAMETAAKRALGMK